MLCIENLTNFCSLVGTAVHMFRRRTTSGLSASRRFSTRRFFSVLPSQTLASQNGELDRIVSFIG